MTQVLDPLTAAKTCINFKIYGSVILALLFAITALVLPKQKVFYKLEILFNRVARKREKAVLLVGLIAFLSTAAVSFIFYWPTPSIQDEFAYLLAADTFAHGRLTNPAHSMWVHLETFHVLHQPTYAAKYPPGQGLFLALGQVLTGYPVVGLWLSMALACAVTCWMLQAWLPPRWALLGSLLMLLRLGLFSYWGQSYWGGAIATVGGALVFGALRRIIKRQGFTNTILFGLGLAILANTRPYEGFIVGFIASLFMFIELRKKLIPIKVLVQQVALPLGILLAIVAAMMAYYNWSITGNALYFPYQAYEAAYGNIPNFLWAKASPNVTYNHEEIRKLFQIDYWNTYISWKNYGGFIFTGFLPYHLLHCLSYLKTIGYVSL
ncbi:MAG: hypothetical protein FD167_3968 [bacterium]|nr:MAG: hypothetical protein FD167_3968 [bacterium]